MGMYLNSSDRSDDENAFNTGSPPGSNSSLYSLLLREFVPVGTHNHNFVVRFIQNLSRLQAKNEREILTAHYVLFFSLFSRQASRIRKIYSCFFYLLYIFVRQVTSTPWAFIAWMSSSLVSSGVTLTTTAFYIPISSTHI